MHSQKSRWFILLAAMFVITLGIRLTFSNITSGVTFQATKRTTQRSFSASSHQLPAPNGKKPSGNTSHHDHSKAELSKEDVFTSTGENTTKSQTSCVLQKKFSKCLPITALASYPGSGNTWMRYLLEETTGIYTGSIFHDVSLIEKGYEGEGRVDGSVVAVKTHAAANKLWQSRVYDRAVILMRNPADTLLAEFNRRKGGHTGFAPISAFKSKEWKNYVTKGTKSWFSFHQFWFQTFDRPIHVVRYESLKEDLETTLLETLAFLDVNVNQTTLECVIKNSEGYFHRPHRHDQINPFGRTMKENFLKVEAQVKEALEKRQKKFTIS